MTHQPETDEQGSTKIKNSKKKEGIFASKTNRLLIGIIGIIAIVGIVTQQVYARPVTSGFVRTVSKIVPFPAIKVGDTTVTMREFLGEYDAIVTYFGTLEGQEVPPEMQLESAIADTLKNKVAIRTLAQEQGISINQELVEQYYQEILIEQESEEVFEQELQETFGWTVEDFKEHIIESIVMALQMSDAILSDEERQSDRAQLLEDSHTRLQAGELFEEVARDVHDQFALPLQSDLGFVSIDAFEGQVWAEAVLALEEGDYTDPIHLPEAYAIFKLEERTTGEEEQLHLLTITVPKITLENVVDDYLESVEVVQYVGV